MGWDHPFFVRSSRSKIQGKGFPPFTHSVSFIQGQVLVHAINPLTPPDTRNTLQNISTIFMRTKIPPHKRCISQSGPYMVKRWNNPLRRHVNSAPKLRRQGSSPQTISFQEWGATKKTTRGASEDALGPPCKDTSQVYISFLQASIPNKSILLTSMLYSSSQSPFLKLKFKTLSFLKTTLVFIQPTLLFPSQKLLPSTTKFYGNTSSPELDSAALEHQPNMSINHGSFSPDLWQFHQPFIQLIP